MAGLYLHIPFCTQRCVYCDFYFTTTRSDHSSFVDALCTELATYSETFQEPLETIYLGGGTPSLLRQDDVHRIMEAVRDHYDVSNVQETTLELNPEDADLSTLRSLRSAGVNRLSIGVQSFFNTDLRFMNRSHSAKEAKKVVPLARQAGFEDLSLDLIFGLPDQPADRWRRNVKRATEMEVPHLSTYGLTVEEKTPLKNQIERGVTTPASDDVMRSRYQQTMDLLRECGYEHYEISSYARPNHRARHNSNYWQHANYLGLGPSAHSFWWDEDGARRWANPRSLRLYEKKLSAETLPRGDIAPLGNKDLAREYILLRLRTMDGLNLKHLRNQYGYDLIREQRSDVERLAKEDYLQAKDERLQLTDAGKHVCDAVTEMLVPT